LFAFNYDILSNCVGLNGCMEVQKAGRKTKRAQGNMTGLY